MVRSQTKTFLVTDHTGVGSTLVNALQQAGWQGMLCHRGTQALDSVRMQPWDALIIRFRLIDMRGDAVAYAACAERPALAGHILILTDEQIGREAVEAARFTWLPSDAPMDTIVAHVAALTED